MITRGTIVITFSKFLDSESGRFKPGLGRCPTMSYIISHLLTSWLKFAAQVAVCSGVDSIPLVAFTLQRNKINQYSVTGERLPMFSSVADPHNVDADPDPAFHFDADPDQDPTLQFDDPDPITHIFPDMDHPMLQNDPLRLPPFTLMRIQLPKIMQIHADPDPQHCLNVQQFKTEKDSDTHRLILKSMKNEYRKFSRMVVLTYGGSLI